MEKKLAFIHYLDSNALIHRLSLSHTFGKRFLFANLTQIVYNIFINRFFIIIIFYIVFDSKYRNTFVPIYRMVRYQNMILYDMN